MAQERLYLYPIWLRFWHFVNALLCLILIVTGVSMQFSAPAIALVKFDTAVAIHNIAGIILTINYLIFFIGNLFAFNGSQYQIKFKGLMKRLMTQATYYTFGIFKGESPPFPITRENKFNPLQRFSYVFIMYLFVPVVFITGWALLYPQTIPTTILRTSGLHLTDLFHIISGFIISLFMLIHIYFCTIGASPGANFKSIMNGYHEPH
ncbi:MAG: cytochrome b/b6 domain-containing protein [Bacteroidales bacterium]|nr:cytochrome b/b6 domain-containing protein [Bacteroidales bacterium]